MSLSSAPQSTPSLIESSPPVRSLHILTVNTHKGFTFFNRRFILPELREAIRIVGADLVFLQEVLGTHERHAERVDNWPEAPQYEFLADSIWSDFAYGQNAVYPFGDHGNALMSKFPILHHKNYDVSIRGPERRGLLHSVLQVPGQTEVHTVCVHLGLSESHRQQQLGLLCDLLDSLPPQAPVIVAGDFNDWRQRACSILQRRAGLQEVFAHSEGRVAQTFPARWPLLRLDRIYIRNARLNNAKVLSTGPWPHLSDHLPLAAEIDL
jgi:endonuclease/exonuclease/phosphatase family metal-dependent hydrolase